MPINSITPISDWKNIKSVEGHHVDYLGVLNNPNNGCSFIVAIRSPREEIETVDSYGRNAYGDLVVEQVRPYLHAWFALIQDEDGDLFYCADYSCSIEKPIDLSKTHIKFDYGIGYKFLGWIKTEKPI